jgi:predicted secreted Zn-dependent protease
MRAWGRFLLVLLALAAIVAGVYFFWPARTPAPVPVPSQGRTGDPLAGISGLQVTYYDVSGQSVGEIREALNRVRPTDPNDNVPVDALASWYIAWRWPGGANGTCDLARAEIRFTASVRLPRLINEEQTPEPVRTQWQAYVTVLRAHEADHVRHAYENSGRVLQAIRSATCATADAAGQAAIRELGQYDRDYDRTTRHGFTQGAHFP